jgi:rubredoxin
MSDTADKAYMCVICGWIYEEAEGVPEAGIEPGTRWEDIPEDFVCPECGAGKQDFEMIEI